MSYFHIYSHDVGGRTQDVVSLLPHEHVFEHGLVAESIVGVLITPISEGGELEPDNFMRNAQFVSYLHEFIAGNALRDPMLVRAAESQRSGQIYVIDARTPTPDGAVPPQDIVGAFRVEDGAILAGSYQPNPGHYILSDSGFFGLSPLLMDLLRESLIASSGDDGR